MLISNLKAQSVAGCFICKFSFEILNRRDGQQSIDISLIEIDAKMEFYNFKQFTTCSLVESVKCFGKNK